MSPNVFDEQIWRMSLEYRQAYAEGYQAAKREIAALLKKMEPFRTATGTTDL